MHVTPTLNEPNQSFRAIGLVFLRTNGKALHWDTFPASRLKLAPLNEGRHHESLQDNGHWLSGKQTTVLLCV